VVRSKISRLVRGSIEESTPPAMRIKIPPLLVPGTWITVPSALAGAGKLVEGYNVNASVDYTY
jgi:hypothetical protein